MNRVLALATIACLVLYPVAWLAPLARAGILPYFSGTELTILGAVRDLWQADLFLCIIVVTLAIIAPFGKMLMLGAIQMNLLNGDAWMTAVEIVGKLSMADIFLIALYIVITKGVGIGYVETAWGLYLFTALVLGSIAIAYQVKRTCPAPDPAP